MTGQGTSDGKWISMVKLGPKSQIVIPKEAREIFGLGPGDALLLLADRERGIALVDPGDYTDMIDTLLPEKPQNMGEEP